MATYYVYSGAGGAGTGADWANAYTTLTTAVSGKAAGDVFFIAHDHAESTAGTVTLTSPGSVANPAQFLCVNRAGSVPPISADLRTTATVSTTGANTMTIGGSAYWYGVTFRAGDSTNQANINFIGAAGSVRQVYESCGFTINNSNASSRFNLLTSSGQNGASIDFRACTFTFGASSGQAFSATASALVVRMIGGSVGGTSPSFIFNPPPTTFECIGVDFSAYTSGKTLISNSGVVNTAILRDCKLGASVTVAATPAQHNSSVFVVNSDSGDTNYRQEKYAYQGTLTQETTIVRSGGASDGTTSISWKIVTTANAKWTQPFECPSIALWNDSTGSSKTVTVYGVWGGGAVPLNDEIWIEVHSLNTSGFPISSVTTTTKADILASGANTTSDSSTWGGGTTAFRMAATVTPAEKGPFYVVVKAAKASSTFYIDPEVVVT